MEPATKKVRPAAPPPPAQAAGAEDRLSALDDGTLHAILARVPLRDAAATTVLSRRWPRVFATLPRLRVRAATFNRRGFPDKGDEDFCEDPWCWMDALGRVLDGRAAPVAAFDIDFKYMGLYRDWFDGVFAVLCGSGGLLELSLVNTKFRECYHLPAPIYGCATLTSLDLYNWRLQVPGRITGLRALRLLRLRSVTATEDHLRRLITRAAAAWSVLRSLTSTRRGASSSSRHASRSCSSTRRLVLSRGKVSMPKVLPKRRCLFGLEKLSLALDHNHEVFATLASCLLNSSPNLKHLRIDDSCYSRSHVPLPAEYWKEQVDADGVLNHLSSVTFFIDSIFEGHPCGGFYQFLVTNARVLKKISIMYYRRQLKPEDAAKLEAVQKEIQLWPRASPDLRLQLCPLNHYPSFPRDYD